MDPCHLTGAGKRIPQSPHKVPLWWLLHSCFYPSLNTTKSKELAAVGSKFICLPWFSTIPNLLVKEFHFNRNSDPYYEALSEGLLAFLGLEPGQGDE